MSKSNRIIEFILLLVIAGIFSCSKQTDTVNPEITVFIPRENQIFQIPVEMQVEAIASDDVTLGYVKINLVDRDFNPVLPAMFVYPEGNYYSVNTRYIISDLNLPTATYYLKFQASDGVNTTNRYVGVNLNTAPRELTGLIMIHEHAGALQVRKTNTDFSQSVLFELPGDYSSSAVSSAWQQFFFAGKEEINFVAYDLSDKIPVWHELPVPDTPFHGRDNVYVDDDLVYVSYMKGYTRGYNADGVSKFATPADDLIIPGNIIAVDDRVVVEEYNALEGKNYLTTYYKVSGVIASRISVDFSVEYFAEKNHKQVYYLGNSNGNGVFGIYDFVENDHYQPHPFDDGSVKGGEKIDSDNILIYNNTAVYWYQYNSNSLVKMVHDVQPVAVQYEDISGSIYIIGEQSLRVYSYPLFQEVTVVNFNSPAVNMHLWYNKRIK